MAQRKRNLSRRVALSSDARAWLNGDRDCCIFFQGKFADDLQALWKSHGDTDAMFFRRGMRLPITLEYLERLENAWLGTGNGSEYSIDSSFVATHYSDEEKQELFAKRGDRDSFRWKIGMWKPLPIDETEAD